MTDAMPTIAARNRHKIHGKDGKFAPRPAAYVEHMPADAWPDSAMQQAAQVQRAMSVDMLPMPEQSQESVWRDAYRSLTKGAYQATPEPIERETWADIWADVRGVVLCAGFVAVVLAFGAHVAGWWPQ